MYSQYVLVGVPLHTARIACWFSRATTHWSNFCTRDGIDSQTVLRTIRESKTCSTACSDKMLAGNLCLTPSGALNHRLAFNDQCTISIEEAAVPDFSLALQKLLRLRCPPPVTLNMRYIARLLIVGIASNFIQD